MPRLFRSNIKTTIAGVATAIVAVSHAVIELINGGSPDWATTIAAITVAIGLLFSKDA
tara:strand:- start:319 stop:492 length:174 start_codon:yes stop_codon:yes gene_type:complete